MYTSFMPRNFGALLFKYLIPLIILYVIITIYIPKLLGTIKEQREDSANVKEPEANYNLNESIKEENKKMGISEPTTKIYSLANKIYSMIDNTSITRQANTRLLSNENLIELYADIKKLSLTEIRQLAQVYGIRDPFYFTTGKDLMQTLEYVSNNYDNSVGNNNYWNKIRPYLIASQLIKN